MDSYTQGLHSTSECLHPNFSSLLSKPHGALPQKVGDAHSLTVVLLAVLFHVNLQLPFRGFAIGITVCRGGESTDKTQLGWR